MKKAATTHIYDLRRGEGTWHHPLRRSPRHKQGRLEAKRGEIIRIIRTKTKGWTIPGAAEEVFGENRSRQRSVNKS